MSKHFIRDTVIGNALGLPSGKELPVSRWKRLWENTGGAIVDGFNAGVKEDNTPPPKKTWPDGYDAEDRYQNAEIGSPFFYPQLPDTSKHIRLLQLLPGSRQDDVRCLVYDVAISDPPEYEALSYCWGHTVELTPIQVNDHTLHVTKSLRSALFHLRKSDEPRTLWVDAICINQEDFRERGDQVSIMGAIYSHALQTVVWLGSGDDTTDRAFEICTQLAEEAHVPERLPDPSANAPIFPAFDKNDSSVEMLIDDCTWWRRVWIVQEIVLAQDALLVLGTKEIDWKTFCRGIDRGISNQLWDTGAIGIVEDDSFRWYKTIISMRSSFAGDSPGDKLLDLLIHVREREATNPRDKVFSVLGLLEEGSHPGSAGIGIEINYEISDEDVFKNTAVAILKNSTNLDILGVASTNAKTQSFPSWTPSWAYCRDIARPMRFDSRGQRRTTHASRGTLAHSKFQDDDRILILSGHQIDVISDLADVLPLFDKHIGWETTPDPDEDAGPVAWFKSAFMDLSTVSDHLLAVIARLTTYIQWEKFVGSSKDQETVYWQTVCGCGHGDLTSIEILYREWHAALAPIRNLVRWRVDRVTTSNVFNSIGFVGYLKSTWTRYPEFGMLVEAQAAGRRLARTSKGSLCLVPADAKQGDSIVLAKGGRAPLAIRPVGVENEKCASNFWYLVGECYIHGAMDGEAFREEDCVDIRLC